MGAKVLQIGNFKKIVLKTITETCAQDAFIPISCFGIATQFSPYSYAKRNYLVGKAGFIVSFDAAKIISEFFLSII